MTTPQEDGATHGVGDAIPQMTDILLTLFVGAVAGLAIGVLLVL